MRKYLEDLKALIIAIISLVGGFFWANTTNWDYEPIILMITSGVVIITFLILKLFPKELENIPREREDKPRIEAELRYNSMFRSNKGLSYKNQENPVDADKAIWIFELTWKYSLFLRNNSSFPAYYVELNFEDKKFTYLENINRNKPFKNHSEVELSARFLKVIETIGIEAAKNDSIHFPNEVQNIKMQIKYQNEKGKSFISLHEFVDGHQVNRHE